MILLTFLTTAVILWLFNFDEIVAYGINEIFNKQVSQRFYWFIFFATGFILEVIHSIKTYIF